MDEIKDLSIINQALDELLQATDLSKVSASGVGFEDLPDAYYLTETVKYDIKMSPGNDNAAPCPMITLSFKVLDNGWKRLEDEDNFVRVEGTKGRWISKTYWLSDTQSVKKFTSDMLKFENPEMPGEPILDIEYFTNSQLLRDAMDIIASQLRIYIKLSSYEKKDTKETKQTQNLVKWSVIEQISADYNVKM